MHEVDHDGDGDAAGGGLVPDNFGVRHLGQAFIFSVVALCLIALLLGLLGCEATTGEPITELAREPCEVASKDWQTGTAAYPKSLTIELDESAAYNFAIALNGGQIVPDQIFSEQGERAPVVVKCGVAARLSAVDDGLDVSDDAWTLRRFTPSGVVQWSWSVAAKKPGTHQLRLEFQPAILLENYGLVIPVGEESPYMSIFTTNVDVTTTPMQMFYVWWDEN